MAILTLTESAEQKIKELCSKNNKYAVKLGIKGGGCAGFSYDWGFAEKNEIDKRDELIEFTRVLDRVLLWNHYVIPQWHISCYRTLYWDIFDKPKIRTKYS